MSKKSLTPEEKISAITNSIAESIAEASDNDILAETDQQSTQAENVRTLLKSALSKNPEASSYSLQSISNKETIQDSVNKEFGLSVSYQKANSNKQLELSIWWKSIPSFLSSFKKSFSLRIVLATASIIVSLFIITLFYTFNDIKKVEISAVKPPEIVTENRSHSTTVETPVEIVKTPKAKKDSKPTPKLPKSETLRGKNIESRSTDLSKIKIIFIDSTNSELKEVLRQAIIDELKQTSLISTTEDRNSSDARLKITDKGNLKLTFELISGEKTLWKKVLPVEDNSQDSLSKIAKEYVENLIVKIEEAGKNR
ncbi:MAG: hypothetical protein JNN15_15035 [Blastocatellia bacterium]|nr:hypothetical protein [Blastocatellia bacterium]